MTRNKKDSVVEKQLNALAENKQEKEDIKKELDKATAQKQAKLVDHLEKKIWPTLPVIEEFIKLDANATNSYIESFIEHFYHEGFFLRLSEKEKRKKYLLLKMLNDRNSLLKSEFSKDYREQCKELERCNKILEDLKKQKDKENREYFMGK